MTTTKVILTVCSVVACNSDIDECAVTPQVCSQKCTNIEGSYTCSCAGNYTVAANDRTACVRSSACESQCGGIRGIRVPLTFTFMTVSLNPINSLLQISQNRPRQTTHLTGNMYKIQLWLVMQTSLKSSQCFHKPL